MASSVLKPQLSKDKIISVLYHNIFNFPLNEQELAHWKAGPKFSLLPHHNKIQFSDGFYYGNLQKSPIIRVRRSRIAQKKLTKAKRAAALIIKIPTVRLVAISGSLAMKNASKNSDIDLLIVTDSGCLWFTRASALGLLLTAGFPLRRARDNSEADKLCLNIWMDYRELVIEPPLRSGYTAHEIAQLMPLFDKHDTYNELISQNKWVKDYWPDAAPRVTPQKFSTGYFDRPFNILARRLEPFFYRLQCVYMRGKRTRETINSKRAFFHPFDWGEKVSRELAKRGVKEA